jgi:hypothetical protein
VIGTERKHRKKAPKESTKRKHWKKAPKESTGRKHRKKAPSNSDHIARFKREIAFEELLILAAE